MTLNALINLIGILIIIVIVIAIFYFLSKNPSDDSGNSPAKHARENGGVDQTLRALSRYASSHGFQILRPAKITSGGKTAQLDAVLVTYCGVIGVRCLGYNGEVFANPGESEWLWVTAEGRRRFPDPVAQCAADARVLRDLLIREPKLKNIPVECLAVFTDKDVQLSIPKSVPILRRKDLIPQLEQSRYLEDKGIDADRVTALLKGACEG